MVALGAKHPATRSFAMEFSSGNIVVVLVSILSFIFYFAKKINGKHKLAPEAGGAWPLVGHLQLMASTSSTKLPHITLAALADKYGPIFTIRLGVNQALIVSNWELAKELFTTCDAYISSRPRLRAAKHLGYNFAMFGFSPYGSYWRELRKLISVELLSNRRIELLKHVRVSETVQSVNELYKLWEEKKDGNGRLLVEMKQWFGDLNLNVVLRMVAGKRFFGAGVDGEEARRCREVMRDFFYFAGVFVVADALPFISWLDLGGYEKRMKRVAKELDELVEKWLEEHRQKPKEYSEGDFMDVMLAVVKGHANVVGQYDPDTVIKSTWAVHYFYQLL